MTKNSGKIGIWLVIVLVIVIAATAIGFSRQMLETQQRGNQVADILSDK